jgi:cyclic beta-1,2-glucan synthetase
MQNMERLKQTGALARYGFYEALDYTPERVPKGQQQVIIRSFMAHHQGMSLVALGNVMHEGIMPQRFHADPLIRATELLLQERIPQGVPAVRLRSEAIPSSNIINPLPASLAVSYDSPNLLTPRTQLLSNGSYSVLITSAGAGASWCNSQATASWAVTRWREDITRDHWGSFCYIRDVYSGALWSTGYQPIGQQAMRLPQGYEVAFTEERAVFKRQDRDIHTQTEILVSPEDNGELRRVTLTNHSLRERDIELTSYAEIVLAPAAADAAHPAFSNLFVETEFLAEDQALIARRRPRSPHEGPVFAMHTVAIEGTAVGVVQYETSRQRFLGRGHDTRAPQAIIEEQLLSNTVGAVLDPIFSLRQRVRLQPN